MKKKQILKKYSLNYILFFSDEKLRIRHLKD